MEQSWWRRATYFLVVKVEKKKNRQIERERERTVERALGPTLSTVEKALGPTLDALL